MVPGRRAKSQIEAGSRRPPDAKHPFGYGRIEYFSAIAIAALVDLGYRPEQVSKILITHKHIDHTGELRAFPNAEIICSAAEAEADEIKPFHPTVATFRDGPYFEFPASQKIADGIAFEDLPADWRCPRCKQGKDKFNPA